MNTKQDDLETLRIAAHNTLRGQSANAISAHGYPMWCMACATDDDARPGTLRCAGHAKSQAKS